MSICVIVSFDPWFPLSQQADQCLISTIQSAPISILSQSFQRIIMKKADREENDPIWRHTELLFFFEYVHLVLYLWVWSFPFFPFPVSLSLPPARCVDLSVIRNSCPFMGLSGHLNVVRHRVTSDSINGPEAITNSAYMSNSAVARPAVTSRVCGHLLCHLQL